MTPFAMLATIAVIHLLAIASPGPTLMVVMSQAVAGSRRTGFLVVAGVVLATLTWSSVTAAGLGGVIARFGWLYLTLKLVGAAYLVWLAWGLLKSAFRGGVVGLDTARPPMTDRQALRAGYLTTMSNPKVAAYYASLFGVVIPASAPTAVFAGAILTAVLVSLAWWSAVVLLFGLSPVRNAYARARRWMDGVMGALLLALAGRLAFGR